MWVAVLKGVAWTAYVIVASLLGMRVAIVYGPEWGFALSALCAGAAWAMTDRAALLIGLLREAMAECGLSEKAAGIEMGLAPNQLSAALAGKEQLSFSRAASLPDAVWEAFAERILARSGRHVVLERGLVADLVLSNRALAESYRQSTEPRMPTLAFSADRKGVA